MTRKDNSGLRWLAIVCGDHGYALYAYPDERDSLLREQDRIIGEFDTHREAVRAVNIAMEEMRKIELWAPPLSNLRHNRAKPRGRP